MLSLQRPTSIPLSTALIILFIQLLATTACSEGDEPEVKVDEPEVKVDEPEVKVDEPEVSKSPANAVEVLKLPSPVQKNVTNSKPKTKRWLGLSVANMTEPIPGAPEDARTQIQRAARGSPAHKAGLRRGDVITAAAGQPVKRFQDYLKQARDIDIGEELILQIARNGRSFPVHLTMQSKPKNLNLWKKKSFPGTEPFPFTLTSLRPEGVEHSRSKGKLQLLYFWATWCGPCRQVAPAIEALHKEAGDLLEVIAISSEEEVVIKRHLRASSMSYPVAHDANGWLKQDYEIRKLPTAVLLGRNDKVLAWDYGLGGVQNVLRKTRKELRQ